LATDITTVEVRSADGQIEVLRGTPEHPFYVANNGGIVEMGRLGIVTQLVTRAGPAATVVSVKTEKNKEGVKVFNFEIEGQHSYFVGKTSGGLWVHNACNPQQELAAIRKIGNAIAKHARTGPKGEISGAIKDLLGKPVPKPGGGFWNHLHELEDAMRSLEKNAKLLAGSNNPLAIAARKNASEHLDLIWKLLGEGLY
jgi:hypothetical protein